MMRCLAARRRRRGPWSGVARIFLALMALAGPRERTLSAEANDRPPTSGPPYGIEKRIAWTTSRITGSPEPPLPYRTERLFPKLKFVEPLELVALPGSDRWLIIEHAGKIFSFPNDPACESPDLFADLKQLNPEVTESYSLAFHPQFARNRQVYIWYILKPELPDGTHVSRFKVTDTNPPQVDLKSEQSVITWKSGGHNGGCIRFGLDGYLYISTGDGAGPDPPDPLDTGQDIGDLLSSILRIDVDHAEKGRPYRVPPDNPFVNMAGARPEVWAYGLRNPWRMSIDRQTGDLWVGDVGWELWEMIYRVQRGGNYGWSILEGSHQPVKPDGKRGPTPLLPPTREHPHSEAASITGGCVYRGKRLPELAGGYIYGDYETGKIWELRHDGSRVTRSRELVDTRLKVVSFGEDREGELYIVDFGGTVHRLVVNPAANTPSSFPRKLSETGLFSSVAEGKPAPGVISYSVNAELWADHAQGERFVALPGNGVVTNHDGRWEFPKDAVLAKTYSLELERGNPKSRHKLETQILHFNGESWNACSFQWNEEQTDATLVGAKGTEQTFAITDADAPGGKRHQTWRFHSRAECLRCHNPWCNTALAFNPPQLDKELRYAAKEAADAWPAHGGSRANQLQTFAHIDLVAPACIPDKPQPTLANPYDPAADLNARARSYLHVNCSHCHREHAGGSVLSYMNFDLPLEKAALAGKVPSQGSLGIAAAKVVASGDPFRSVLWYRMAKLGKGHMPYLGASVVDERGVGLIHDWIKQLPASAGDDPAETEAVTRRASESAALARLRFNGSGPPPDPQEVIGEMLSSVSGALALLRAVDERSLSAPIRQAAIAAGTSAVDAQVRDLFERFLPEERRAKTLGSQIDPGVILVLRGDAARGRKIFTQEGGAQCQTCHRAEGVGRDFGPDLSQIGKKYARAQILENILEPSKAIDPQYVAYLVETRDDTMHTGFLIRKSANEVVLKEATAEEVRLPAAAIKRMEAQRLSLMPEGLLQGMTAQEAADLIEYLQSLR